MESCTDQEYCNDEIARVDVQAENCAEDLMVNICERCTFKYVGPWIDR